MNIVHVNDFTRGKIMEVHYDVLSFLNSTERVEARALVLRSNLEANGVAIPEVLYKRIEAFIEEYIEVLAEEDNRYIQKVLFPRKKVEDEVSLDCLFFRAKCLWMDFVMEELHPHLVG